MSRYETKNETLKAQLAVTARLLTIENDTVREKEKRERQSFGDSVTEGTEGRSMGGHDHKRSRSQQYFSENTS